MNTVRQRWSYPTKVIVALLLLVLFVYSLFRFSALIPPLVLAIILAYILSPLVFLLEQRLKMSHLSATLLSYLILIVTIVTLPLLLVPLLADEISILNLDLQLLDQRLENWLGRSVEFAGLTIDGKALVEQGIQALQGLLTPFFERTVGLAVEILTSFVWVIFIIVVSFYLVKDGAALRRWVEEHIPAAYLADYTAIRNEINQIWSAFFRGQITLALVVATIFTVIGFVLGLPFALAMGILAGLLEFLPSIGHGIWLTIAAILAFSTGSTWLPIPPWGFMLLIIGLHLVFQQFDLNYLIPRIIGHSVHLPPLVVILGIVAGAVFAGIMGIPLAAPTIASARVILRYVYANLFDLEPYPDMMTPLPPPNPRWWRKNTLSESPKIVFQKGKEL